MSVPTQIAPSELTRLPGAPIIARIRRLIWTAIGSALVYSTFISASKGGCPGGVDADGGFVDANGVATEIAPMCTSLTMRPSWIVLVALAAIVLGVLGRVLRRAEDETAALRMLDRAALAIMVIAGASIVIAQVWFAMIPLDGFGGTGTYVYPFPFGAVELDTYPMTGP
ncbi:hypothetical protein GCM10009775_14990 [Microbacterium aoyamense]|uniref:Uncharacterized protein n=1 Tax=Microbacterium aoyamense TaxID=344166 RepID=A0ABN2PJQ6_9MICO|nr:hypothetical protein [Microbacterium aoyamense]